MFDVVCERAVCCCVVSSFNGRSLMSRCDSQSAAPVRRQSARHEGGGRTRDATRCSRERKEREIELEAEAAPVCKLTENEQSAVAVCEMCDVRCAVRAFRAKRCMWLDF